MEAKVKVCVGIKARVSLKCVWKKSLRSDKRSQKKQRPKKDKLQKKIGVAAPSLSLSLSLRSRSLLLFRVGASNCNVQNEGVNVSC